MKVKMNNFNFVTDGANEYSKYTNLKDELNYFFLDGKEDVLFAKDTKDIEEIKKHIFNYDNDNDKNQFERDLLIKYQKIINLYKAIKADINEYLNKKVNEIYENNEYSRYELYNNISLYKIANADEESKFEFQMEDYLKYDLDNNKILIGGYVYNPYLEKIENIEEQYKEGNLKDEIRALLILKEIQERKAPKFISAIYAMNNFLNGKKQVNVGAAGLRNYKVEASLDKILNLYKNEISLESCKDLKKQNPEIKSRMLDNDLAFLSYNKEILSFPKGTFKNLDEQIMKTPIDKFLFAIDKKTDDLQNSYNKFTQDYERHYYQVNNYYINNVPYQLENAYKEILSPIKKDIPEWYKDNEAELNEYLKKYESLNKLRNFDDIKEFKERYGSIQR